MVRRTFLIRPSLATLAGLLALFSTQVVYAQTAAAPAKWRVASPGKKLALGHGAYQTKKALAGPHTAELNLIFFDSVKCSLKVQDQPRAGKIARGAESVKAIAACNGGYFTPEFEPLGLSISKGQRVGKIQKSSLLGGMLVVRKDRPSLIWRDEFTDSKDITDLIQAGPRLASGGKGITGLEAQRRRARTFLVTDNKGRWAMGTCKSVTLKEMSDLLVTPGVISEFTVARAINLDGGSSTALWWREANGTEHYEPEYNLVRNYLTVVPR